MITLALETSTPRGGVALFRDGALVFCESFMGDRSHSSELFVVIERAMAGGVNPDRIVVGLGPGSYAGVRIAIAAAIGISVATGAELIGVPSIAGLAEGEYIAVGDARRGGYSFAHLRDGEMVTGPMVVTVEEARERMMVGGIPVYSSEELGWDGVEMRYPEVERVGTLGDEGKGVWARDALEPIYLREPHITQPKN